MIFLLLGRFIFKVFAEIALQGRISKESPVGQALLGRRVGERVLVKVNENGSYPLVIRKIEKCAEDESVPINPF